MSRASRVFASVQVMATAASEGGVGRAHATVPNVFAQQRSMSLVNKNVLITLNYDTFQAREGDCELIGLKGCTGAFFS